MDNNASTVIIILLSAGALVAVILLVLHLLRLRQRRRYSTEHNIMWHFALVDLQAGDRPPVLPVVLRPDSTYSTRYKTRSYPRFSWFGAEDKTLSTANKDPIGFPERAVVTESRRSRYDLRLP
ncbi:hypothetical protein B0H14DRAFT_3885406 [Mycena olivaceomarginata]|nr:hypothetical protein B0H14DRAFT_3885406 [Mycena olivaceomarginata]